MNRFFVETADVHETYIVITGPDVNHMKNVLRLKIGEKVCICAGNNIELECGIKEYNNDEAVLDIVKELEADKELHSNIHLFQGLPKADKMELIIQKCVELGVHEIIPVAMKRCVVKLDEKKTDAKLKRWQAISESAAKQSGRAIIPNIHVPMNFNEALSYAKNMNYGIIPYELAEGMEATREALNHIDNGMDIAVFIGPEGGFDVSEIDRARDNGIIPVSLGRRILRTETAGLTIMSILMYHLETKDK